MIEEKSSDPGNWLHLSDIHQHTYLNFDIRSYHIVEHFLDISNNNIYHQTVQLIFYNILFYNI